MKRLAIARLWYEGNSFSPLLTELHHFQKREWVAGAAARDFYRGTATEIGAAVAFAEGNPSWSVEFLRCAAAPPGGKASDAAFAAIRADILSGLGKERWNALYLSLHGAMVTGSDPTPELHLLQDVRAAIGATPLAVSFDLHANLGPALVDLVDVATGYKTYPHVDMDNAAARALDLLTDVVEKRIRPVAALVKVPGIYPSFNMRTTDGPMAEIAALAAAWRGRPGILEAAAFGGFAYGDSPFAGPAAMVFADADRRLAQEAAAEIAAAFESRRERFLVTLPSAEDGIATALAMPGQGPAALLDPADNPLSGGIGDTPGLLAALLKAERLPSPMVFAFFCNPSLVARAHQAGIGTSLEAKLGARLTDVFGPALAVTAQVEKLTDGRFRNLGPYEHNLPVELGRTALLDVRGIKVIITESCQTPNDPGYFALHGIDLAKVGLLAVKAKNHFRAGFKDLVRGIVDVDLPGPAAANLARYDYRFAKHL